ncbi:hypothetical protein AT15_09055 [Kosmotoga arenicorallina S304]|uniref:Uncharacterized protein n=1 Tax=Kosmotoga arenicorallina S304 TaxID=1453497 RepID=A0A176K1T1_9BACT|nr:hypothetical protein [Kosmotoga arenicorallina]OAA31112.1 hypothetical protein AT15_09055 [Kosmotoga arenicorallina S304]
MKKISFLITLIIIMLAFLLTACFADLSEIYNEEAVNQSKDNTTSEEASSSIKKVLVSRDYYTYDGLIIKSEYYDCEENIEKILFYDIEGNISRIEVLDHEKKEMVTIYDSGSKFSEVFGDELDPGNEGTWFEISTYEEPHISYTPVESWSDTLGHLANITVGYVVGEFLDIFIPSPVASLIDSILSQYVDLSPEKNATLAIQEGKVDIEKIVTARNDSPYVSTDCVYAHARQYYRKDVATAFIPIEFDSYGLPTRYEPVSKEGNKSFVGEKKSPNYYDNATLISIARSVWEDYVFTGTLNIWNEWWQ